MTAPSPVDAALALLANAATLAFAVATVAAALLRRSEAFRRWCLRLPLSHGVRRGKRGAEPSVTDLAVVLGCAARRRVVLLALSQPSRRTLDGDPHTASDALAELLPRGSGQVSDAPHDARVLRAAYAKSLRGSSSSLLARLLYGDDVERVAQVHRDLVAALDPFAGAAPVTAPRALSDPTNPQTFAGFVTALSGAPVLVDAAAVRSRHADGLLTWHRRSFRDGQGQHVKNGYPEKHATGFCSSWQADTQRPGDFDRRMLDLRSVAMVESSATSCVSFALGTWETCYAATELGAVRGCKKVPARPGEHDGSVDPVFSRAGNELLQAREGRLTLLTSYVSVLTSDGLLALTRRSSTVRNGAGVLSATAGGIVEPDEPGPGGDVSASGTPDPAVTASRECLEEIGLDLPVEAIRPVAVFLANVRDRSSDPLVAVGQLVGVVLSLARTEKTLAQMQADGHSRSDMSKGRFEWDELLPCPAGSATAMAGWAKNHARDLDQHGLLSVIYASMTLFGPKDTRIALLTAFADGPWWCGPLAGSVGFRTCRDVGPLVGTTTSALLGCVSATWLRAWDEARLPSG